MAHRTDEVGLQKPVTIQDVAKAAGVSKATVSRVLNGSGPVDSAVAERVRGVIASLKYQPNRAARALSGNRSVFIGLVLGDIENPFTIAMLRGVEEEVRRNKYLLVICNNPPSPRVEEQHQYFEILVAAPVAGAIINPVQERLKALELLKARNVPVVTIDQRVRDASIDSVRIDNIQAAKELIEHVIKNGYRRIGIVTGPKSSTTANDRLLGYRQALQEAGIALDPDLEARGPFIEETGQQAAHAFLDLAHPPDAIFAANNRQTAGVYRTLVSRKKRVPQDIALVGFDQVSWDMPGSVSITTIMQPGYELGRAAANRLMQHLKQPETPKQDIILPHQLVIRESSRPHRSSDGDDAITSNARQAMD